MGAVSELLLRSRKLLRYTLQMDERSVENMLEIVHDDMQEFKEYNSEHILKCIIHLTYYAAQDDYEFRFEQTAENGYADCIMIPRKPGQPGILLELKYDSSAENALKQIHEKKYVDGFPAYVTSVVLVGINYNKKNRRHECKMEQIFFKAKAATSNQEALRC